MSNKKMYPKDIIRGLSSLVERVELEESGKHYLRGVVMKNEYESLKEALAYMVEVHGV